MKLPELKFGVSRIQAMQISTKDIAKNFLRPVLDFVYPPRCMVCNDWIGKWDVMCAQCAEDIKPVHHPLCPICGRPFESASEDHPCGACIMNTPPFDALRAAAFYEGSMRDAILRFKFGGKTALTRAMADAAFDIYRKEFAEVDMDVIIPVPLHPLRLRWRGFNQSLLLARHIGKRAGLHTDAHTLKRIRDTVPQVELTPKQRATNVKGAFGVSRSQSVDGKRILLVDDVATTCATLIECAKVLKKAGAREVYALTVARPRQ